MKSTKKKDIKIIFAIFFFLFGVGLVSLIGTSYASTDTMYEASGDYGATRYSIFGEQVDYNYGSDVILGVVAEDYIFGSGITHTASGEENPTEDWDASAIQIYPILATKKTDTSYVDYIAIGQRNTNSGVEKVDVRIYYWNKNGQGFVKASNDDRKTITYGALRGDSTTSTNTIIGMEIHFYEEGTLSVKDANGVYKSMDKSYLAQHELTDIYTYLYLSDMDTDEGYRIITNNEYTLYTADNHTSNSNCPETISPNKEEHVAGCSTISFDHLTDDANSFFRGFYLGLIDLAGSLDNSITIGVHINKQPLEIDYTAKNRYGGQIYSNSKKLSYHLNKYPYGYNESNLKSIDRTFATYTNISKSKKLGDGGASQEIIDSLYGNKSYVSVAGYNFNGWYTSNKLIGDQFLGIDLITSNIHLYGAYEAAYNPPTPIKTQDTPKLNVGDSKNNTVTYTITQAMPTVDNKGFDQSFMLSKLSITDTLDSSLEYVSGKLYYQDKDITSQAGTVKYDSSTHRVIFDFSSAYLKTITNYNGQSYSLKITARVKNGTNIQAVKNKATTYFNEDEYVKTSNEITTSMYYPITVNYVDGNNKKLLDSKITYVKPGDKYTTTEATIPNYNLINTTGDPTTGTMGTKELEITYVYALKKTKVVVNYIDEFKKKLADSITINGTVFDNYETTMKTITGYKLISTPMNAKGTMTEDTIVVNYIYTKKEAAVSVNYVDEEGNTIADSEAIAGYYNDPYETKEKEVYGYELTKVPINAKGNMEENPIEVTYVYRLKDTKVIVKYVDEENKELADSVTISGKVFDPYNTEEAVIYGYELVELPENSHGTMKEETIEVVYVYRLRDTSVIAKYVDEDGKELMSSITINGKVFDPYTTESKKIDGYALKEVPANANGEMSEEIINVVYVYSKIPEEKNPNTADINIIAAIIISVLAIILFIISYKKIRKIKETN